MPAFQLMIKVWHPSSIHFVNPDASEYSKTRSARQNAAARTWRKPLILLGLVTPLVVRRLGRLSRSLRDLIETFAMLESRSVQLMSFQESLDTTKSNGKLVFHLFGVLAGFERNLIHERTVAGLQAARARGRQFGRPLALNIEMQRRAVDLYEKKNLTVPAICVNWGYGIILCIAH